MREEVLVYVNGRPLVLREDERPFKNMQVAPTLHIFESDNRAISTVREVDGAL